jgi:hypothetical protein
LTAEHGNEPLSRNCSNSAILRRIDGNARATFPSPSNVDICRLNRRIMLLTIERMMTATDEHQLQSLRLGGFIVGTLPAISKVLLSVWLPAVIKLVTAGSTGMAPTVRHS